MQHFHFVKLDLTSVKMKMICNISTNMVKEKIMNMYVHLVWVKFVIVVEGDQKVPFSIAKTPMCRGGSFSFPWIGEHSTH